MQPLKRPHSINIPVLAPPPNDKATKSHTKLQKHQSQPQLQIFEEPKLEKKVEPLPKKEEPIDVFNSDYWLNNTTNNNPAPPALKPNPPTNPFLKLSEAQKAYNCFPDVEVYIDKFEFGHDQLKLSLILQLEISMRHHIIPDHVQLYRGANNMLDLVIPTPQMLKPVAAVALLPGTRTLRKCEFLIAKTADTVNIHIGGSRYIIIDFVNRQISKNFGFIEFLDTIPTMVV
jgi:hypothetical protein